MNYIELNLIHKQKMDTLCNNPEHFEWEDTTFMDYLKGSLPRLRNTSSNSAITGLFHSLTKKYSSYSFYDSEPIAFISEIEKIIDEIRKIEPYWSGVFIPRVEETIRLHKGCLISGEGGIGKSYFIKCLEEEFKTIEKKHLCLYGKFCPTISEIDFNEISAIAKTEEFVFIFDAINEIDEQSQLELINELKKIKDTKGLRIIITYRTHTMDESMIEECRQVVKSIYEFEGVSFESVVEWLQRIPITDINEYLDVLYSNNPFLLSKLPCILDGKQDLNKNNVSRFTYIYEQFIKKSLDKPTWENTKKVARLLYENNKKNFSAAELDTIIDDPLHYISVMEQIGSLMCNYFLDNFATYNNDQESIGYEVYDPIEYGEELKIKSPLPIFQPKIEKMCDKILSHIESPPKKDDAWWKDLDLTKKNLLNILQPIEFDSHEWVLLSCRISLRDPHEDYKWKDTYDLFVCSSADETIINDGNERYLTIEIDDYNGDLLNYKNCTYRPWLCKSVPDIAYNSGLFDDTRLVLPPTEIISLLNLSLNLEEMCWYNDDGDKIICCNNNKASYYQDPITGAVFIRKDVYEQLLKLSNIKFFAFAEKYIEDKGFCPDSAFHFEIVDGKIVKAYPNCKFDDTLRDRSEPQKCLNCKHGFYSKAEVEKDRELLINIIKDYGY